MGNLFKKAIWLLFVVFFLGVLVGVKFGK